MRPDGFNRPADDPAGPNCGLTAIAVVTGKPFQEIKEAYRRLFTPGPTWNGGTTHERRAMFLAILGVKFTSIIFVKNKPRVETFARRAPAGTTYILRHRGHVCTLRDGWIVDNSGVGPATHYRWRKALVTHALEIEQ